MIVTRLGKGANGTGQKNAGGKQANDAFHEKLLSEIMRKDYCGRDEPWLNDLRQKCYYCRKMSPAQAAVHPPSIAKIAPVMERAKSEVR